MLDVGVEGGDKESGGREAMRWGEWSAAEGESDTGSVCVSALFSPHLLYFQNVTHFTIKAQLLLLLSLF